MTVHTIVGLKRLDDAKSRLSPALDAATRRAVMEVMVVHVLATATRAEAGPVWLASSEPSAATLAAQVGVAVIDDGGLPWNDGLAKVRKAVVPDGDDVLYLGGDLPLLSAGDLRTLLAERARVVVARARDGGSNALVVRPATAFLPSFGLPRSSEVHADRAEAAGLTVAVVDIPGLALDVDTIDDLRDAERAGARLSGRGRVPGGG